MAPTAITLPEAIELIVAKRDAESKRLIKTFDEDADLQILNGRFGIYIAYKKANYKIPRTITDPASLTYEQAMEIVNNTETKPRRTTTRRTTVAKKK
jgi:DNA topoisomerase-1